MKDKLYLLRPGFRASSADRLLYCSDSVSVEGLLGFFPQLRSLIDVYYLEFERPRAPLVNQLGQEHQSAPVLILADSSRIEIDDDVVQISMGRRFIAGERPIRHYLSTRYSLPQGT